MKTIILIAAACLSLAGGADARDWSATGPNGGSVTGSGSCAKGEGSVTCQRASDLTGARGRVYDRGATRTTDAEGTVKTFVTTGARGRSVSSVRTRTRGH